MATSSVLHSPVRICALSANAADRPKRLKSRSNSTVRFAKTTSVRELEPKKSNDMDTRDLLGSTMDVSEEDRQILSLLNDIPQKKHDRSHERLQLYSSAVKVYEATNIEGCLPLTLKEKLDSDRLLKRKMFQLVFDVLHHKEVIEEMLTESNFYSKHSDLHGHETLVLVMAYDFQDEKFAIKLPKDEDYNLSPTVVKVAEALWSHKVKLGASLARMRVRGNAQTFTQLISDPVTRLRYENTKNSFYCARVNLLKVKNVYKEVLSRLQVEGIPIVQYQKDMFKRQKNVYQPKRDLLIFSSDCRGCLDCHVCVTEGFVVLQDLPSYCAVEQLRSYIEQCNGDILFTDCNAGTEVLHFASILGRKGTIKAFGVSPSLLEILNAKLCQLGLKNVQLITAPFMAVYPLEDSLCDVKMIVCMPTSAHSPNVTNQVDYVLEAGDQHLRTLHPSAAQALVTLDLQQPIPSSGTQIECLKHALKFDQAEHIVHLSRPHKGSDSRALVRKAIELQRDDNSKKCFSYSSGSPPVVSVGEDPGKLLNKEHIYSITVIEKQRVKPPPAKDVIARAVASGLLDIGETDETDSVDTKKQISKSAKIKRKERINALHQGIPMTAQRKAMKKTYS